VRLRDVPPLPLIIFPRAIAPPCTTPSCRIPRGRHHAADRQEAIQMQTIVSLVSAGMGMALVPQSVSNLMRPGVEYRPLQTPRRWWKRAWHGGAITVAGAAGLSAWQTTGQ
jgi:DNA-binding transcriptional LysR family regulator